MQRIVIIESILIIVLVIGVGWGVNWKASIGSLKGYVALLSLMALLALAIVNFIIVLIGT